MSDDPDGWSLQTEDRLLLVRLQEAIRDLVSLGRTGQDIIAIGEALDAIECLLSGDDVDVNVGLDVGFRRGDSGFEEGLFVCFRINDEEISLDELHTTYSRDVGSDHFTVDYARLGPTGHFSEEGVEQWLQQLQEIRVHDDAALTVSRDHI